ncbi:hypothetical protein P5G65_21110 [Paenibacillus chondroitinus]|uniref:SLH domain-containing protein n=1 Tax=Paenibacillus chondroitinus TaxID=59842 RepID=A0ABU6DFB2_9BACL|nr:MULTISPECIES: hypothetical protein [Paenibacillus]MCY9659257.1 hypothetical protein [Paenibacillus anseongense]MEB4796408.1 hypothetical protein [Paenibacillus chondroitinus]
MKRLLSLLSFVLISLTLIPVTHAAHDTVTGNRTSMVQQSEKFKDLSDLPQDILDKFDVLIQDHVFDGVSDHSFGLNEKMNRAQFAKVAAMIFALPIPPKVHNRRLPMCMRMIQLMAMPFPILKP